VLTFASSMQPHKDFAPKESREEVDKKREGGKGGIDKKYKKSRLFLRMREASDGDIQVCWGLWICRIRILSASHLVSLHAPLTCCFDCFAFPLRTSVFGRI